MNPLVDNYLLEGCGRCPLVRTPECKVHLWPEVLRQLRTIILSCGLNEELKWSVPCYTFEKSNVVILGALKNHCSVSFLKGVLLSDRYGLLEKPGENSQAARLVRFTTIEQVHEAESILRTYLQEAIQLEKDGKKVAFTANSNLEIPSELEEQFQSHPGLQEAFWALTPGRQRGYVLHFSAAKQSKTKTARIQKWIPSILDGKGMHD